MSKYKEITINGKTHRFPIIEAGINEVSVIADSNYMVISDSATNEIHSTTYPHEFMGNKFEISKIWNLQDTAKACICLNVKKHKDIIPNGKSLKAKLDLSKRVAKAAFDDNKLDPYVLFWN